MPIITPHNSTAASITIKRQSGPDMTIAKGADSAHAANGDCNVRAIGFPPKTLLSIGTNDGAANLFVTLTATTVSVFTAENKLSSKVLVEREDEVNTNQPATGGAAGNDIIETTESPSRKNCKLTVTKDVQTKASIFAQTPAERFAFANQDRVKRTSLLHPVIQEFQDAIESDPELLVGFTLMFDQIPHTKQYELDYLKSGPQVRDYHTMLARLNDALTTVPRFGVSASFPMTAIFGWPMCTQAGFNMFMNSKVNKKLHNILKTWTQFLESPDSRSSLTKADGGWFSPAAAKAMPNFAETYECDPNEEYYGFPSFDAFFTRKFREGVRPVDGPDDPNVITNACESEPFRVHSGIKEVDQFWLKGQPYSLRHMLNNDSLTPQFVGGTIFQSYLSGNMYHRWHSPIDGRIVKVEPVLGTYFAISPAVGFTSSSDPAKDRVKNGYSEGFMSNVAARLIIFIQGDNPDIGLMAFIAIGMVEVSSCEPTVKVGDRVRKGDQLGIFHFGGSTYCMVFRPETKIEFTQEVWNATDSGTTPGETAILLNKRVGVVKPRGV
ncbi:hypothetical protein NP233_g10601 [Leucocoprinus birnbaumii]|uniref:L-tryptophan decarboxylase PsiD-like domain-containing protein n=1 Tax=Leucocoprinus birnbaumii TaxID=56174 RepID=A0AAD5YL52_9AGAR|nr:hypothetical protein NP233_g10601 [Leucocoprinus birnbaumii]